MGSEAVFRRYFLWFDLCAVLFAGWLMVQLAAPGSLWAAALNLLWLAILLWLLPGRRRDEFAQQCWRGATEAAFTAMIVAPLTWAFLSGFVDGLLDRASGFDLTVDGLIAVVFATFFAAFQWHRFRGGQP